MATFDELFRRNQPQAAPEETEAAVPPQKPQEGPVTIVFYNLPSNISEFKAMAEADLSTPFKTAALTVLALTMFPIDKDFCYDALNFLRGPRELTPMEKSFINDRFMDGKGYIPRSYFEGATPENDYMPNEPLTIVINTNPYSYNEPNMATLHINSGGADSPRQVQLRYAKDGKWYLWEQFLLSGIRQPESENPWA